MNKRIKKKNDYKRKNDMLYKAIGLIDVDMTIYAHLVGRKDHHYADDAFWNGYDEWNWSLNGRRTWSFLLKKNNIPKHI